MSLIKKGAEANLYLESIEEVFNLPNKTMLIIKHRMPKKYREPQLDRRLRENRTALEAKLIADAKTAGVATPIIYEVDKKGTRIIMEFVEGTQVKMVIDKLKEAERKKLCEMIGRNIARLHQAGIVHGDLTTSNIILTKEGQVFFVDFGLGEYNNSLEARGVDLHLLKRTLKSTHFRIADKAFHAILKGYEEEFGEGAREISKRVDEIEKRGRYIPREEKYGADIRNRKPTQVQGDQ